MDWKEPSTGAQDPGAGRSGGGEQPYLNQRRPWSSLNGVCICVCVRVYVC